MKEQKGINYGPGLLPMEYTPIRWDELVVGEEIGPVEFDVKPETHQKHTEHLHMKHPWFTERSPWGDKLLYPWETDGQPRVMSRKYGRLNQGINTAIKWELFKPVKVGQMLVGRTTIIDKYQKRGKDYYKNQTTTSAVGEVVFRSTCEFLALVEYEGKLRGESPLTGQSDRPKRRDDGGKTVTATRDLPVGYQLPSHTARVHKFRYATETSGGVWPKELWQDSIHTDEYAQKFGFKGGIAEGPIVLELALLETLVTFFGESLFTSGVIDVKFTAPVYVGDTVTGKGKVGAKLAEDSNVRLVLDIQVEKEDGSIAIVGSASALVP